MYKYVYAHSCTCSEYFFVGCLQIAFLSLKFSVRRTRFLYKKTRMKAGKNCSVNFVFFKGNGMILRHQHLLYNRLITLRINKVKT